MPGLVLMRRGLAVSETSDSGLNRIPTRPFSLTKAALALDRNRIRVKMLDYCPKNFMAIGYTPIVSIKKG